MKTKKALKTKLIVGITMFTTLISCSSEDLSLAMSQDKSSDSGCFDYMQTQLYLPTRSAAPSSYEYEVEMITNITPNN